MRVLVSVRHDADNTAVQATRADTALQAAQADTAPQAAHDDAVPQAAQADAALRAAQDGDEDAFRVLYRSVQPGLVRYLRVLVGEDAEDVASEAWLQIARDLGKFRGDLDGFRGWSATIARHRALDHLRRARRRPLIAAEEEVLAEQPADDDTAGTAIAALGTDAALALIASLPRDQAEAVLLRAVLGLDARAAARVLGKRPGAVRTAAYRGLRTLAARLAPTVTEATASSRREGVTPRAAATLREMR
ncbi:MAG TPA: RNA polymerase sigma factor [Amycolatopsis sp.]|nr:RNA polymerase sigma factor [Amycolatopsis sp.]